LPSQVLRYGFRTINGKTGGVRLEQLESVKRRNEAAATADFSCMFAVGLLNECSRRFEMHSFKMNECVRNDGEKKE
jgi:hypothetical protein